MHIPRYWARGDARLSPPARRPLEVSYWHWSDISIADAQQRADIRSQELLKKFQSGEPLNHYGYTDRPQREEIIQTLDDPASAIITRNRYGALVLNTASTMFIDIDFPAAPKSITRALSSLFRKSAPSPSPQDQALNQLQSWSTSHPDLALRIYRTHAGLRCLITNCTFNPTAPESLNLLRSAGSDPLYIRLCQSQSCFRARLTPKPWRCNLPVPPARYPYLTSQAQSNFQQWQSTYETSLPNFTVCQFLTHLGPQSVHPDIHPILTLHDQHACANPQQPLA